MTWNNSEEQVQTARVGFVGNRYDVLVHTDDPGHIPHVHVVDLPTHGQVFSCCIQLETNRYFRHKGTQEQLFDGEGCAQFNDFMRQPCRIVHYRNNYEFAVAMWNSNNYDTYLQIREDRDGNLIMPDYATIVSDSD